MTIAAFWLATDAEQTAASAAIRSGVTIEPLYAHGIAFESWRRRHLEGALGSGLPFWHEAQNDFLLSLLHGGRGVWRSALHSLRSFLENSSSAVYFSEHPVEARRFDQDSFRLTWSETKDYFRNYPYQSPRQFRTRLFETLADEYAKLSAAVHGSAATARMTATRQFPVLCSSDPAAIATWVARTERTARSVHFLLLQHFATDLQGARLPALREDIGRVLSPSDRRLIRTNLTVTLPTP